MPVFRLEMVPSFHHTNIVSPKMLTSFVMNKIFFLFVFFVKKRWFPPLYGLLTLHS